MRHYARALLGASAMAVATLAVQTPVDAQNRARVGVLDCDVSGGIGLIVGSRKQMTCTFAPSGQGPREVYTGSIGKFGLDVGATPTARLTPACPCTESGCSETVRFEPPTSTFAPSPAPTDASAEAPA